MARRAHAAQQTQLQSLSPRLRLETQSDASRPYTFQTRHHAHTSCHIDGCVSLPGIPQQYALPLRSTQFAGRRAAGSEMQQLGGSEHLLRRKTPCGTLVAAYDGRSVEAEGNYHVEKHLLLPAADAHDNGVSGNRIHSVSQSPTPSCRTFSQAGAPASSWLFSGSHLTGHDNRGARTDSDMLSQRTENASSYIETISDGVPQQYVQAHFPNGGLHHHPEVFQRPLQTTFHPTIPNDPQKSLTDPAFVQPHQISFGNPCYDQSMDWTVNHATYDVATEHAYLSHLSHATSRVHYADPTPSLCTTSRITEDRRPVPSGMVPSLYWPSLQAPLDNTRVPFSPLTGNHSVFNDTLYYMQSDAETVNQFHSNMAGIGLGPNYPDKILAWAHRAFNELVDAITQARISRQYRNVSQHHKHLVPLPHDGYLQAVRPRAPSSSSGLCCVCLCGADANAPGMSRHQRWCSYVPTPTIFTQKPHPAYEAAAALESLSQVCQRQEKIWIEGTLLAGCLAHVLGRYKAAIWWFSRILERDASHVVAISNIAATYVSIGRKPEAEYHWRKVISLRPASLEAVEHLIGLLCSDHRHREAANVIDVVQQALLTVQATHTDNHAERLGIEISPTTASTVSSQIPEHFAEIHVGIRTEVEHVNSLSSKATRKIQSDFRYRRYSIAHSDNGRLMALLHAKGNILYNMHDHLGAAKAFEEVILIAAGQHASGIDSWISIINGILLSSTRGQHQTGHKEPNVVLLGPEQALQIAKLCFPPYGNLPGLMSISSDSARKSATSVTSNSLLSLAKIVQDGMAPNAAINAAADLNLKVGDILILYYLSLSLQPNPSTANNMGILLASIHQDAVSQYPVLTSAKEHFMFPGVVSGSGIALALAYYNYGLNLDPRHAHLYTNLGSLLKDIGQLQHAVRMYEKAVECEPNFDIALANLANAVKDQGKIKEAIVHYKRAVQVNPDFAEAVCGLANALNSTCCWLGRGGVIFKQPPYDRWHVDDAGVLVDAMNSGVAGSGWIRRVVDTVQSQLADAQAWGNSILQEQYINQLTAQVTPLCTKLDHAPDGDFSMPKLLKSWSGQKWEGARVVRLVERATRQIGWQWYQDKYVTCRERDVSSYKRPPLPNALPVPTAPTVLPFHTFTFPMTARQIRLISQQNGLRVSAALLRAPWLSRTVFRPPSPPAPQLNVGYVSSDFNNHPLAHLMQSVFGMHDVRRVKAFCYATTASDNSSHRQQIEKEAPVFQHVTSWSTERIVQQIVHDNIHILINLNGYTRGARNDIFAARAAPLQMSFMGFAGSLGAEWSDYLLADEITVPTTTLRPYRRNVSLSDLSVDENYGSADNDSWVYQENIIYTRSTFFCCDHAQSASSDPEAEKLLTWPEEQTRRWRMRKELFPHLPDTAVILANFNQLYKIDPTTFRTWLRVLAAVPTAVLWLLRFPADGEHHLLTAAHSWAGAAVADRVLFTDVAPKALHIQRACVADLFLDTPECNAHTTAADCLWSGTPLLTLRRWEWKMCSRIAASILAGALPMEQEEGRQAWRELVPESEEGYEEVAIRLARGLKYIQGSVDEVEGDGSAGAERLFEGKAEGRLVELRKLIWQNRWRAELFDTRRWVRDLEDAYEEAWRRWVAGEGGDIWLKDLPSPRGKAPLQKREDEM